MDRLAAFLKSDVLSALRIGLTMGFGIFGGAWLRVASSRRSPSLLAGPALVVAILAFALGCLVFPGMARPILRFLLRTWHGVSFAAALLEGRGCSAG